MVTYADVLNNNESLKVAGSGVTAVFVGGTGGIGLGALRALTKHTDSPTIYIVGRSESKLEGLIADLKQSNETANFVPIIAQDLSLVKDAQDAALQIAKQAQRVDLLIMSCGYISFSRDESPEGLDRLTSIRYYSRMRFLVTLAPLLRASPSPRVVTVLGGGMEGQLFPDDLKLKDHYSVTTAAYASGSMTTLFLEEFAHQPENEKMVFVHIYPGYVGDTAQTTRGLPWYMTWLINWVVGPLMRLFGPTAAEAGERVIFAGTNGRFRRLKTGTSVEGTLIQKGSDGQTGSGVYLVQPDSEVKVGNDTLRKLREEGMAKVVWDHTLEEFERIDKM